MEPGHPAVAALPGRGPVKAGLASGWDSLLLPALGASLLLFLLPQALFVKNSLYAPLGFGRIGDELTLQNFGRVLTDSLFLYSFRLTAYLSFLVAVVAILLGFPLAYFIARSQSRWRSLLVTLLVVSSFITVVIKSLGLIVILGGSGPVNRVLVGAGLVERPLTLLNNQFGVVVGLLHYTFPLMALVLLSVVQTIPASLEEAAEVMGAPRRRVFTRILLPLCLPGVLAGGLMVFNMSMGAFTSAALLGGGRVPVLPILIQRKIISEVNYPMGATMSVLLLVAVVALNVLAVWLLGRFRRLSAGMRGTL
ncbi:MAG: ABC transporter permease [Deltaproteobacteria bacterium]|nr:ABC transporter permease [Deltaproteobacteria bacterium]MBI3077152.1 ABC transporter permease [Deltaproteobacteria bacterium]